MIYLEKSIFRGARNRSTKDRGVKEQLEFLLSYRFTANDVGLTIGCSVRTVHRRLSEHCSSEHRLSVGQFYTNISDEDSEEVVSQINQRYPRHGYRMVKGHLLRLGIQVARRRVRDSSCRVDPEGIALGWSNAIQRRTYNVYGPNALWHIDGQHGLIRWGLVIHGGE